MNSFCVGESRSVERRTWEDCSDSHGAVILAVIIAEWVIGAVWFPYAKCCGVVAALLPHQATQKLLVSILAEKEQ